MKRKNDLRCGRYYLLPDSNPTECDPDGVNPCCSDHGWCGNTAEHCSCSGCVNYTLVSEVFRELVRDWEESGGKIKWRKDSRCGSHYPLPDGNPTECDPDGVNPCCSDKWSYGLCGNTAKDCSSYYSVNYTLVRELARDWEESGGKIKWRKDFRCGSQYSLLDGKSSECDPDGVYPCCSHKDGGQCGNTAEDCSSEYSVNYTLVRKLARDWEESGSKIKWRKDFRCGSYYSLSDGNSSECDPNGWNPCCSSNRWCGFTAEYCLCSGCVDYRIMRELIKSEEKCVFTAVGSILQNVCYETGEQLYNLMCHSSNLSAVCKNYPYKNQACGLFNPKIPSTHELCGAFFCDQRYLKCGKNCKIDCSVSQNNTDSLTRLCDDKCDDEYSCEDESDCNGYKYGIHCKEFLYDPENFSSRYVSIKYVPVFKICNKVDNCYFKEDEQDCIVSNSTSYSTTLMTLDSTRHYCYPYIRVSGRVPILNYTRCSVFGIEKGVYPYCIDYTDQTNCSDIERVGGYCLINGFNSSVSKYMVCYHDTSVKLCDDDFQNTCKTPSITSTECKLHKHKMCDEVLDCADGSDEILDNCVYSEFQCVRRFNTGLRLRIPVSWIMDDETDCVDEMDEQRANFEFCGNETDKSYRFKHSNEGCENVYLCPSGDNTYVLFEQLCDGVETCGDGAENKVCRIARDFPKINKTAALYKDTCGDGAQNEVCRIARDFPKINKTAALYKEKMRNVCFGSSCEVKEFIRPWGDIYGELKIELFAPSSKVNCSGLFGEDYLLLSCMDLCLDATCPLNNRTLVYDSCPGQYLDRVYTLANSSFLTFVHKSEEGQYHQDYFQCNNTICVDYEQVCDLTDDCGDMSDELNCTNHMICEDTLKLKSTKYQFISLSQRCDGIYDCFDLSDECNDACGKRILGNFVLQTLCWIMGVLALIFNSYTVFSGLKNIHSKTGGMLINKALVSLIGSGDLLIGLYLVVLSFYDSLIYGNGFCRHQAEWMTGTSCSILGVISTVGSQVSLFAMTTFSFTRMYGLTFKKMRVPGHANKSSVIKVVFLVTLIIAASIAIAVIPLIPFMEEYFVQGMYYDPSYKVFIGFPNKEKHVKVLQAHYNNSLTTEALTNNITNISMDMTWKEIGDKVDGMYNQQYGMLSRRPVHFYGNDGVCLFKYFVRSDDARRNRQSLGIGTDPVVWLMLGVNLTCFITITCCYIVINIQTKISSRRSGQDRNPDRARENRAIQNKITIIILTDFLCWVPLIFISGMHNCGFFDASKWYVTYAMIALPLNSVVNPLLYDRTLTDFLERRLLEVTTFIRLSATTVMTLILRTRNEASPINGSNEPEIMQTNNKLVIESEI